MLEIRHQIPGRERWRIRALYRNAALGVRLQEMLAEVDGVHGVRVKTLCASLVVHYDRRKLDPEALYARVAPLAGQVRPAPSTLVFGITSAQCTDCGPAAPTGKKEPWLGRILSVVLLTGYLGYVLVREYVAKAPVPQNPLSPTGVVSMVAAVPLLKDAWKETFEEKRFTIHQFLAFSLLLGIFAGEALTAFEIIYVLRGAKLLEDYAADRSRRAIRRMLELSVKDAWVLEDGVETQVPLEALQEGDLVVVRTGWKVPIDGAIEQGEALLDESTLTGRSELEFKVAGDAVFAGSYLEKGLLHIRARKVGGDTYLARVAALVEASLDQKAPLQQRADELAARLLKLGTLSTVLTLVVTRSLSRAFTVMLVMSCPCATILAASTAVSAAIHNAARRHVLVKGGAYLEQIGGARVYCFDKTGTITTEETEIAALVSDDEKALLYWAASAELRNPHALAGAITRRADALGIEPDPHGVSEHVLGKGVKSTVSGSTVLLGNRRMMLDENIDISGHTDVAQALIEQGLTAVYVVRDGRPLGVLGVAHRLRAGARAAVERLRAAGVERIYLVSGDEGPVAEALSRQLGLDGCHAELLPEDKARVVREMNHEGGILVMVGDGVNDAPALAEADIGVAMGAGGSEVAIEVADIALADSDIQNLIYIGDLSRATLRVAEQNYYLAVGTNLAGIVLGASGWLTPAMGGLIHIAHTLGILLNSSRLLAFRGDKPEIP